ncbi:hypothetical protein C8J56DRAFT_776195 [Mycena floridula]|nr:hypothetical protein C8J56DRAFT_776195 [Mycena floridula]
MANYSPNESPAQLFAEKGWLQGAIVSAVFYGVALALFPTCVHSLYQKRHRTRQRTILLVYVCAVFLLDSLFVAANSQFTQLAFIDDRNYPGGPAQYEADMWSIPVDEIVNLTYVIANWLSDAVLVWRAYVVFQGVSRYPMWIIMFAPGLVYLASITMGTLWLIQVSASNPWASTSLNWTVPYFSVSLGLNVFLTLAIVSRLLLYRFRIKSALGPDYGTQYLSLSTMIVESAALYSIFSLLFLIPFILGNAVSEVFLQALGPVQTVSSFLIVSRVTQGKAWNANISAQGASNFNTSANYNIAMSNLRHTDMDDQGELSITRITVQREVDTVTDSLDIKGRLKGDSSPV